MVGYAPNINTNIIYIKERIIVVILGGVKGYIDRIV